jgi:hypothetical protein
MNSSDATNTSRHFTITYRTPDNRAPVTEMYKNVGSFHKSFKGWRFTDTNTKITTYSGDLQDDIDPTVIYDAKHPFLPTWKTETSHHQVSDKVFEEKSIKSLEHHLLLCTNIQRRVAQDPTRKDGWRFLTAETDIAEWEGIWEGPDGHIYFLEAKHLVSNVNFQHLFLVCSISHHFP